MHDTPLGALFLDLEGQNLTAEEKRLLSHPMVGGVIFFARNFSSLQQLSLLVVDIRRVRPDILLCVDHEGGRVQRFREGFTRIPAMQRLQCQPGLVTDLAWLMASELIAFDIDFSFAPVLDADDNYSSVIGDRAFSSYPTKVAEFGADFVRGFHEAGMAATGKHFPGHGAVKADSHLEQPVDTRELETIIASDLYPFQKLQNSLDALMPAHILFPEVDENYPVGFSKRWLKDILRGRFGFRGVLFSDDLTMEGAAKAGGIVKRAQLALEAGCDAILVCNNRSGVEALLSAYSSGSEIPKSPRLNAMRRRKAIAYSDLVQTKRWRDTCAKIAEL